MAMSIAATEAQRMGLLKLPSDASWASTVSAVRTLATSDWSEDAGPLVIFFDQFENIFRDESMTREFRDLALGISEAGQRVIIGFAWKTDYVGWTEGHPFHLRDEIRNTASLLLLEPLGAREIETLLRRLEKAAGRPLGRELKQRLREVSQGLPWLFKKLAGHVLLEMQRGSTAEKLVAEALNVQALFESDLAELSPQEQSALVQIARFAPLDVAVAMEKAPRDIVQSLLDRRLIVQVGEKLDTYWDIFRDFLVNGRIPIEDAYILRMAPSSVSRLLRCSEMAGGDGYVPAIASELQTSDNAVWNLAREVRLLGLSIYEPNRVKLLPEIWGAGDRETAVRERVAAALRRHKAYSTLLSLVDQAGGRLSMATYATQLALAFPAVSVAQKVWATYARVFVSWLEYAGLAILANGQLTLPPEDHLPVQQLFGGRPRLLVRGAFPSCTAPKSAQILRRIAAAADGLGVAMPKSDLRSCRDLVLLGAVEERDGRFIVRDPSLVHHAVVSASVLRPLLEEVPGGRDAIELLHADPAAAPLKVGRVLQQAYRATDWKDETVRNMGKSFRSWARLAGIRTSMRAAVTPVKTSQGEAEPS
jgi:hypothetical protein